MREVSEPAPTGVRLAASGAAAWRPGRFVFGDRPRYCLERCCFSRVIPSGAQCGVQAMPTSCPGSLQRIPDMRRGKMSLRSSPRLARDLSGQSWPTFSAIVRPSSVVAPSSSEIDQKFYRGRRAYEYLRSDDSIRIVTPGLVGCWEERMNIRAVCGALILGGLVAAIAPLTLSLAQSIQPGVSAP